MIEAIIQILHVELHKNFKKYLKDFAFYNHPVINRTLLQNLESFSEHIRTADDYCITDAMDNDLEYPEIPCVGQNAIRWNNNKINNMSRIADAIHMLNNNSEDTQQIVDRFTTIRNELIRRNLWLI